METSMAPIALHVPRALTPLREIANAVVVIEGEKIAALGTEGEIRLPANCQHLKFSDGTLVPGFVDIHIHGAGGHDCMEATPDALSAMASAVARFGTTSLLATTVTASLDHTLQSLRAIAGYIAAQAKAPPQKLAARIAGIHFEGPFISIARRGVHPAEFILPPSLDVLQQMLEAASGHAKILTLAPEEPGALELIAAARQCGLVVSMGHTDATYDQARAAIEQGARHTAHMFNAMRPFSHRDTGIIGAVMTAPEVTAELIADGTHVEPAAMRLLLAAKGAERLILVSDGTAATGMPDGKYALGSIEVVVSGGVCRNQEGQLAGSTLTLDRALRNIVALGVSLAEAVRMLTLNPARLIGRDNTIGVLAPGADADLVLLDANLQIKAVMTRGTGLD
jgi:N-acetylglucosamine-6-phosphate deacetylase